MKLIAIEANIAAGKSTFAPKLAEAMGYEYILEDVDTNEEFKRLLKEYTEDPTKRINFQRWITKHRAELCNKLDPAGKYIIERSLYSDLIFSLANIFSVPRPDGEDMKYYYDIHEALHDYPRVDAVLYLKTDPKVVFNRLLKRGRTEENGTPLKYLQLIHNCHEVFLPEVCERFDTPLITVDWNNFGETQRVAKLLEEKGL
ncbi:TPA: deoxynucleoside kinase [Photobacterium damselae]